MGSRVQRLPIRPLLFQSAAICLSASVPSHGNRILGFTAFGVDAGEMMSCAQIAMMAGLPYTALRDAILTHPTLAEGLITLFLSPPSTPGPADANIGHRQERPSKHLVPTATSPLN